jgi:NAD(P)-dependent dehydrogenase (short-subunit alcohol dehydrogenase family)
MNQPSPINPMDLTGQTVLVTGASSGIGRDLCILLSELGAKVILTGRDASRLEETRNQMRDGDHLLSARDLREEVDLVPWMEDLARQAGPIGSLAHCAGMIQMQPLRYLDEVQWLDLMDLNLNTPYRLAKAFRSRNCRSFPVAKILFLSSVAGLRGFSAMSAYSASKAGLIGLCRTLAVELAREGIRVNCVAPGLVSTESAENLRGAAGNLKSAGEHPLGIGRPRDVSHLMAFLLAPTGDWITGQTFVSDGGLTA